MCLAFAVSQVLAERPGQEMGLSPEEVKRSYMVSFLLTPALLSLCHGPFSL